MWALHRIITLGLYLIFSALLAWIVATRESPFTRQETKPPSLGFCWSKRFATTFQVFIDIDGLFTLALGVWPQDGSSCFCIPIIASTRSLSVNQLFPGSWLFVRHFLFDDQNCPDVETNSETGRAHLLLISRTPGKPGGALGIITLEGLAPLDVLN